jgi:2-oxoglutarate dehydrogenase E2 component (dihydrolipoamide succinyltransferase)
MPTEIVVPDLGESVTEVTIADWLKQEGDYIQAGEAVVVLETDKVDLDVSAQTSGVLTKIKFQQGDDVRVGDVIALIDESVKAADTGKSAPAQTAPSQTVGEQTKPAEKEEPVSDTERATPVARRFAQEQGVDLGQVTPSGARGKITKEDIERHLASHDKEQKAESPARQREPAQPGPAADDGRPQERIRMTRRRRTIAERLVQAQQTAAMLTTFNEVDMSAVMALRQRRQEAFVERHGVKLGIVSFFVKASIGALKAFPQVNAEIDGNDMVLKHYYDIGVAIGANDGLVVPVLRNADRMPFGEIEQTIKNFVQRTENGDLSLEDLRGGTFTITNGGVFGSLLSTPILNPPQVGILGLHKIEDRPVALDGEVVIRPMMYVALSYDHRMIDGREAVQFLVRIKQLVEDPASLLLEG